MSAERPAFPDRPRKFKDQDVIDVAVAVFGANGYAGTSAQDSCNGMGLGRGSLCNVSGSKQTLYEQALLCNHEQTMSAQLTILTQPGLVKGRLHILLFWGIAEDLPQPEWHDAMVLFSALETGSKDEAVANLNNEYRQYLGKTLVSVFIEGQRAGKLNNRASVVEMVKGFMAGYYGLRVLNKNTTDKKILEDVVAGLLINL